MYCEGYDDTPCEAEALATRQTLERESELAQFQATEDTRRLSQRLSTVHHQTRYEMTSSSMGLPNYSQASPPPPQQYYELSHHPSVQYQHPPIQAYHHSPPEAYHQPFEHHYEQTGCSL